MKKIKIFVSYDYDNSKHYKNMLLAWNKNKDFEGFRFIDRSVDISINSRDHSVIKKAISEAIGDSDVFLCIIDKNTKNNTWINWEIKKAKELNKSIVAVRKNDNFESPEEIKGIGAHWARHFKFISIKTAINEALSNIPPSFTIHKGAGDNDKPINPSKPWSY